MKKTDKEDLNRLFGVKTPDPVHDEVVLRALARSQQILRWAVKEGIIEPLGEFLLWPQLEYALDGGRMYIDLALCDIKQNVVLSLEIKSAREEQSASGWTRQVRNYENATRKPCVLVVSHDLEPRPVALYLRAALVRVLDLRTLPDLPDEDRQAWTPKMFRP